MPAELSKICTCFMASQLGNSKSAKQAYDLASPFAPRAPALLQGKLANFENAVRHARTGRVPAHQLLDRAAVQVGVTAELQHNRRDSPSAPVPLWQRQEAATGAACRWLRNP